MLIHYQPGLLECFIEDIFTNNNITTPDQLNTFHFSDVFDIPIYFGPYGSCLVASEHTNLIIIDDRQDHIGRWEDFLHELCHYLRHSGNQMSIPRTMLDWQEWDARSFQMYAAVPHYMLQEYELPWDKRSAINLIAREFGVSYELAERRVDQLQRKVWADSNYHAWKEAIVQKEIDGRHIG